MSDVTLTRKVEKPCVSCAEVYTSASGLNTLCKVCRGAPIESASEDVAASPVRRKKAAKKAAGDHAAALSPPPQEACVIVHGCKPSSCDGVAHSARVIDSTDRRNVLVELVCAHRPTARPWFTHVAWARLIKDTW